MNKTLIATLLAAGILSAPAQTITLWNFNGDSATTVPGGSLSPSPAVGSGTASLIGGVTGAASFGSGSSNGGSSDPAPGTPPDYAWQTTTYPAAAAANQTAGLLFSVSTVGFSNIQLSYDLRHSNTSSRYERVQYSLDGLNFVDSLVFDGNAGDTWFNGRTIDLSSVSGANNNPNFAFRVVAEWESTATGSGADAYAASNTGSSYAVTGTWRFDMVSVTAIPEPSSAALFGLGSAALLIFRRRD